MGYDKPDSAVELARAVKAGGATWLTVHAREGGWCQPPAAHWGVDRADSGSGLPAGDCQW
ncbi:MAG: hypothetical protein R3B54_00295 [Bdellovibrionota bacterium]